MPDTLCLKTRVKNVSGATKFFGFIPPHGREMVDDASLEIPGGLESFTHRNGRLNSRLQTAFEAALLAGELVIVKTPGVFLYDATTNEVGMLSLDDTDLEAIDPCYGSYLGDD